MTIDIDFEIRINPEYESLVPPMTKEASDSLVSSIRADGQHKPITINNKGEILDGHYRFSVCKLLGIEPNYITKKPILQEQVKLTESLGGKGMQICTPLEKVNEVIARSSGASSRQVSMVRTLVSYKRSMKK
jgi:ParB-like chromosome segregation protein Spo0J